MSNKSTSHIPLVSGMLSASQADEPDKLYDVLAITAVKESWIILLIHFHTAIFFGLILLASGYDEFTSLLYLGIHLGASLLCSVLLVILIRQSAEQLILTVRKTILGLTVVDIVISLSWGVSILLFFLSSAYEDASTLVVLLLAAGISSAALSAKLLSILIIGRILVFLPTVVFLFIVQPPDWILHSTSLILSFGVCLGIGYAIHVQLLREASLVVELGQSQSRIVNEAELRERFLRSITHDLRQPLASLGLHTRALNKRPGSEHIESELSAIDACLDSANEIMRSVSQLAWVSDSLPPAKHELVDLQPIFERIVQTTLPLALHKGLTLETVSTSLSVRADEAYLERALRNLVDNAIQYTNQGKILIGARRRENGTMAEIQVWDTGRGIDALDQGKVFDVYERLQAQQSQGAGHMGLGLYIVENLVDAMGGKIVLDSKLGSGSCFGLQLPIERSRRETSVPAHILPSSVCLVDDDPGYAGMVAKVLVDAGLRCLQISEPKEIDELFEEGLPSSDCYLIDYHLSATQSGLDLLKLAAPASKKLLISNFDTPQLRHAAAELGVSFLQKPQGADDILSALKAARLL